MKANSHLDRSELNKAVDDRKALPDMILKRIIFEAQDRMNKAESVLVYNRLKTGGYFNNLEIYRFRISILEVWRLIGEMALDVKILNLFSEKVYEVNDCELMLRLYSNKPMNIHLLHHLAGYVTHCLHVLNLTNLLIDEVSYDVDASAY